MKIRKILLTHLAVLLFAGLSSAASANILVAIEDDGFGGTLLTFFGGTGVTNSSGTTQRGSATTTFLPGGLFFGTAASGGFAGFDLDVNNSGFFRNGVSNNFDAIQLGFVGGTPVAGTQVSELDGATLTIGGLLFTTSSTLIGTVFDTQINNMNIGDITFVSVVVVPEPGSLALMVGMLGGLMLVRRRRATTPA